jgi:hypothetical protein
MKNRPTSHLNQWARLISVVFILNLPSITLSAAQDTSSVERPTKVWARLGAGVVGGNDFVGLGGTVGVQYSTPLGLIGARYLEASRSTVDPATLGGSRLAEISEISASFGLSTELSVVYLSASAGLGTVWGRMQKVGGDERFTVLAIPLEAQVIIRPLRVIGVGAMLSSTINSKKTITSAMLVLQIGKLY